MDKAGLTEMDLFGWTRCDETEESEESDMEEVTESELVDGPADVRSSAVDHLQARQFDLRERRSEANLPPSLQGQKWTRMGVGRWGKRRSQRLLPTICARCVSV